MRIDLIEAREEFSMDFGKRYRNAKTAALANASINDYKTVR